MVGCVCVYVCVCEEGGFDKVGGAGSSKIIYKN